MKQPRNNIDCWGCICKGQLLTFILEISPFYFSLLRNSLWYSLRIERIAVPMRR